MILRRKLMVLLLALTALMMLLAVAALLALQHMLGELEQINRQESRLTQCTGEFVEAVTQLESRVCEPRLENPEPVQPALQRLAGCLEHCRLGQHAAVREAYAVLVAALPADLPSRTEAQAHAAHSAAAALRDAIFQTARTAQQEIHRTHQQMSERFRWLVMAIAAGFLLVINASILLLVRAARLVLQPVDKLLEASRQLAHEHFDYRVDIGQHDEFEELAKAYNDLAQRLQDSEQRKIETLKQVAATLNHELNNALAIIDLQLILLRRRSDSEQEQRLRQIHDMLRRMAAVVESLKHVRRIVLTDYDAQTKMLDLQRSVEDESSADRQVSRR